jgi:two-component system, NtrC family, sensor kinase
MKRVLYLLVLYVPMFCNGQLSHLDSLKKLIPSASTDSARLKLMAQIGFDYYSINYDSAFFYTNKSLILAQKNRKKLNEAALLSQKGVILNSLQRPAEAYKAISAAMEIAQDPQTATSYWNIWKPELLDKDISTGLLASINNAFGLLMFNVDKIDQTIFYLRETQKLSAAIADTAGVELMNAALAHVYLNELNKPDSALELAQMEESYCIQKANEQTLGLVYPIIGASYRAKDEDSLALAYFHKSLSLNKKYDELVWLSLTYRELTRFYLKKRNKDSSLYYANQTLNMHRGWAPMDPGEDLENLSKSYELNQQPDSAFKYQKIALHTYDSLYKLRIKGLIGFQQIAFDQQQHFQQLEAEKIATQNRNRIYFLLGGLTIILLIGFFLYRNNRQQKKANLQISEAYRELKATQAQLIQSEKMASLGELTAGIAHEIQNPLNFVNNFSEVNKELLGELNEEIIRGNYDNAQAIAKDAIDNETKINHHGKRADTIVKGMLQHSRASSGIKELTDINTLAEEYLRLAYHGFKAKDNRFIVSTETHFDSATDKINIVPQDLGRVILNLLNNAFYAVADKKKNEPTGYEPVVSISTKKKNGFTEVTVRDNGNGISAKSMDKIFQPFYTTKPAGEGTGLGLSLSYDIIKAHGGEIKVDTKEGKGTSFIITLH